MSAPELVEQPTCPFLGIAGDPLSRYAFAEPAHRCHAAKQQRPIDLPFQATFCMSRFTACEAYRRALQVSGRGGAAVAPVLTTRQRGDGRRRRLMHAGVMAVAALTVVVAIPVAIPLARAMIEGPGGVAAPPPIETPGAPAITLEPTLAPTPEPIVTMAPTPTPSAEPSPMLTPSPSAAPATPPQPTPTLVAPPTPSPTPIIHLVRRGENLYYLANLYAVSRRAIAEANGLEPTSHIMIGQRLIIPQGSP